MPRRVKLSDHSGKLTSFQEEMPNLVNMRPALLKVPKAPSDSFSVRQDRSTLVNNRWHYHPELELIYFHRGCGTQFVGDNIKRFSAGDLVLVGPNLPHFWRFDQPDSGERLPYSTVVHFRDDCWGRYFLDLPETVALKRLVEKARRGLYVAGRKDREKMAAAMDQIRLAQGLDRLLSLLQCLNALAAVRTHPLSSLGYQPGFSEGEHERMNAIYDYTFQHFRGPVYLEQVAAVAQLVPNSFCRYFKSRTGKTYSQFINEIRVGHACKLLIDGTRSVKQVCFDSGFSNFTSFHETFKRLTGKAPGKYREEYVYSAA